MGERFEEPGAEQELPLDIARQAKALADALAVEPPDTPAARILCDQPALRAMVRRVQVSQGRPFAEIQDNLIAADLLPLDMLRCKLAFFGASRFDPRSDRWVRINLFQNAPLPSDLMREVRH